MGQPADPDFLTFCSYLQTFVLKDSYKPGITLGKERPVKWKLNLIRF